MQSVRIYDLPTRILHASLAASFIAAYAIANLTDDESARFAWHMLAGLFLTVTVVLRLVWGVIGTRHARWSDLILDPRQLVEYLKGVVSGPGRLWEGHNPASSWAAVSMLSLALAMGASGIAMVFGVAPEWLREAHALMANTFLAVVLLHVAGLIVHGLRHHDALPLSMVNGRKRNLSASAASVPARGMVGALVMILLVGTGVTLAHRYDPVGGTLDVFGTRLRLGEGSDESANGAVREAGNERGKREEGSDD